MMFAGALITLSLALLAPASAAPVKPFEIDSMAQIEASQRGKPFIVLVWSMDCPFCQTSLEVLSKARARNPGLVVVTVTTDPAADEALIGQVEKRLSSLDLAADAWSFGTGSPERLRFAIDPSWRGEKPRSYWYDASGKRSAYSGLIGQARLAQWKAAASHARGTDGEHAAIRR